MPQILRETPRKTYQTFARAVRAIDQAGLGSRRWVMGASADGRFFPIFIGTENLDVVHLGFSVVA